MESSKLFVLKSLTRGVSLIYGLVIYIKKYLKAKEEEELWKLKYFHPCKNILIFKKKFSKIKKPLKNPSKYYYNSIITNNLKFQHKPKYISSFKNPHIKKLDLLLLLKGL